MYVVVSRRPQEGLDVRLPNGDRVVVSLDRRRKKHSDLMIRVDAPTGCEIKRVGGNCEPPMPVPRPNEGCIHLRCPGCDLERINQPRAEWDPAAAAICYTRCPECSAGAKDDENRYFDVDGQEIEPEPVQ